MENQFCCSSKSSSSCSSGGSISSQYKTPLLLQHIFSSRSLCPSIHSSSGCRVNLLNSQCRDTVFSPVFSTQGDFFFPRSWCPQTHLVLPQCKTPTIRLGVLQSGGRAASSSTVMQVDGGGSRHWNHCAASFYPCVSEQQGRQDAGTHGMYMQFLPSTFHSGIHVST